MIDPDEIFKNFSECHLAKAADGSGQWHFQIPHGVPYVDGHFPERPVFPAVAIIDITLVGIKKMLSESNTKEIMLELNRIVSAKFLEPIKTGDRVEVSIGPVTSLKNIHIIWTIEGRRCADLSLDLTAIAR